MQFSTSVPCSCGTETECLNVKKPGKSKLNQIKIKGPQSNCVNSKGNMACKKYDYICIIPHDFVLVRAEHSHSGAHVHSHAETLCFLLPPFPFPLLGTMTETSSYWTECIRLLTARSSPVCVWHGLCAAKSLETADCLAGEGGAPR